MEPRAYWTIIFFVFLLRMTEFGGIYFGLENQYKIVLNIVKKFFL